MNTGSLVKRLRREAQRNPKQVAALGLVLLVAGYFWAPLLWRLTAKKTEATGVAEVVSAPAADASKKSAAEQLSWRQLLARIADDPRMRPVSVVLKHDAFASPLAKAAVAPKEKPEPVAVNVTPVNLGLTLIGTVVGPKQRAALLNGKTILQGQSFSVSKDGTTYEFTLARVDARRVVLARGSEHYELALQEAGPSGRIEFVPTTP